MLVSGQYLGASSANPYSWAPREAAIQLVDLIAYIIRRFHSHKRIIADKDLATLYATIERYLDKTLTAG